MLRVVTLALMAIGATAQTMDSLKTAGCVDQSAAFIDKMAGSLTDCAQVASIAAGKSGSCTGVDAPADDGTQQTKAVAFHLARACPVSCNLPCLDDPAPLGNISPDPGPPSNSWTCKQYADYLGITNGDCSLAKIGDKETSTDIAWVWRMCPNQCGAPCVGSTCPPAPTTTTSAATRAAELKVGVIGLLAAVGGWIAILDQ